MKKTNENTSHNHVFNIEQEASKRILILDGATGTAIQKYRLMSSDFGGEKFDGCNEHLVKTRPDIVEEIHNRYLQAGADIIETNSFGSTPLVLEEYALGHEAYNLNFLSAQIAKRCAENFTTNNPSKPRFVAGSIGPTTKMLSISHGITFDQLVDNYFTQVKGLFDGGVDYFLIETCNDLCNVKAAIVAIEKLFEARKIRIPIAVSITLENNGTMLGGANLEAIVSALNHLKLLYLGINCATGPKQMFENIKILSEISPFKVSALPNAGIPNHNGEYDLTPQEFANYIQKMGEDKLLNFAGGCCGTNFEHIKLITKALEKCTPRKCTKLTGSHLSNLENIEIAVDRPYMVGERTNIIGSKKFRDLIASNKFDEAAEIAKEQVFKGASIIDICLSNPERNELDDVKNFYPYLCKKIKVPIMIDSTNPIVVEESLKYSQGKAIINSINLEEGISKFKKIIPLAKLYGASIVVGTIDEDPENGMATTRERKLEIAIRSHKILTEEFHYPEEDIYFDPLVFPAGTNDPKYMGAGYETICALKLIKEKFPKCKSVLGISNVSFGLPEIGREILNSVFLYDCVKNGLDLAIVNTQKLKRYSSLNAEEILLCETLLKEKVSPTPLQNFVDYCKKLKNEIVHQPGEQANQQTQQLSTEEEISSLVLNGLKSGIEEKLDLLIKKLTPLEIINGPLMEGMKIVGKHFNENKLIITEVLQSAEVMKKAVDYLKPFMDKNASHKKGKILLATVKGDVHDIGKNLVEIILSNNGYEVVDLGIKVGHEEIIKRVQSENFDCIGLSGLLVKSAEQMIYYAEKFTDAKINLPVIVGGAALTQKFVDLKIKPVYKNGNVFYAKDAMDGLKIIGNILNGE